MMLREWRTQRRNTLHGFCIIELSSRLLIRDVAQLHRPIVEVLRIHRAAVGPPRFCRMTGPRLPEPTEKSERCNRAKAQCATRRRRC
jgi:hypothetical protein